MSVRYKWKNHQSYKTMEIDGFDISVIDLKKAIVQANKLGRTTDFDLVITDSTTDKEYAKDEDLVPKNSSLIVARHPLPQGQKKIWEEEKAVLNQIASASSDKGAGANLFKNSLEGSDLTEDDKLSQMMSNSSEMYNQKNWVQLRGRRAYDGQKVPPNYRCNKCHMPGHFIHDCPTINRGNSSELKRTTGIPRSFLEPVDPTKIGETPGAKINPQGSIIRILGVWVVTIFSTLPSLFKSDPFLSVNTSVLLPDCIVKNP